MADKPGVLILFLALSCLAFLGHCSRQDEALGKLYKSKFTASSKVDTSPFKVIDDVNILPELELETQSKAQDGWKEKDRIERLPGQPQVNFTQYGGFVTVNKSADREFYYYFAEAEHSKESLPLLLWLNGGPGCSSLGYGAMQELGPFRVYSDAKTLFQNKYSWNKVANVLFVESPAGVGFSHSDNMEDYLHSGDARTAADNYIFLLKWLERFPEYKDRDFYISGESYAGHYVPQLAHTILHYNQKANKTIINLKGIIIGNAVIDDEADSWGTCDYLGNHALVSPETIREIHKYCNFSPNADESRECSIAKSKADADVRDLDIYSIYAPLCFHHDPTGDPIKSTITNFDPCSKYHVYHYLNRPDVQEAIHANNTKRLYDWQPCSQLLLWNDSPSTIIPLLKEFIEKGLRVWIYSGDTDGVVPVTATQYSIDRMGLPVKTEWRPWAKKNEIGGYTQTYEGDLTFATVRGAGHQVPSYQPVRALALITHFLAGTPLATD